ncbi:hypothetical protein OO25_18825 [Phaeobacter sp. S60]|nr:hypothetical protein OO25_18825 [Phaeobacter sp. S60]
MGSGRGAAGGAASASAPFMTALAVIKRSDPALWHGFADAKDVNCTQGFAGLFLAHSFPNSELPL